MPIKHKNLANGRWYKLTLAQQMANIGSEISRAINWATRDTRLYFGAIDRALELIDLTIEDPRWRKRLKEITRVREILCDLVYGDKIYKTDLKDLDKYFFQFALLASQKNGKRHQ